VRGYQISQDSRIVEETLPPEEVYFLEDTVEIPWKCRMICHGVEKTLGELREQFPDQDIPDDIEGWSITESDLYEEEDIARRYDRAAGETSDDSTLNIFIDPSQRKVWHYEVYMKADRNGDGIAEWLQIHRVGDEILSVDEVDYPKIFSICPFLWPHVAVGFSMSDMVEDLQELQTALNRQILDNIYQTNNPRHEIAMGLANEFTIDDYLDNRIGGYIRTEAPGAVTPHTTPPLANWTFNLLEHWEQKRESRTGVSRLNGGMDPDSLNKTATGVVQILNQAARRVEMIARVFAETGFRDRVRGILDLSMEYPEYVKGQVMRLTGETMEMDPDKISGRYDLVVNAGIGSGNRDQHAAHMMQLLQVHQQLAMAGMGPGSEQQMVTMKNIYNVVRDMITNWGHRNTADYITDPKDPNADKDPVKPPQPSPDQLKAQAEQQKLQIQAQKDQAEIQLKQKDLEMEHQREMAKLELQKAQLALEERKIALEEYRTGQDLELAKRTSDPEKLRLERERNERDYELRDREVRLKETERSDLARHDEKLEKHDQSMQELKDTVRDLIEAAMKPVQVKRGEDGLVEEIM
jgi:hypothetical protein